MDERFSNSNDYVKTLHLLRSLSMRELELCAREVSDEMLSRRIKRFLRACMKNKRSLETKKTLDELVAYSTFGMKKRTH